MTSALDREHFLPLFAYNAWANLRAVEMIGELHEPNYAQALRLLSHLLRAERVWLGRVRETNDADTALWETDALEVCCQVVRTNTEAWSSFLSSSPDLTQQVPYTNSQGTPFKTELRDIVSHVLNHSTHHRAQVSLLVREAGEVPLPLDYIAYVRSEKP